MGVHVRGHEVRPMSLEWGDLLRTVDLTGVVLDNIPARITPETDPLVVLQVLQTAQELNTKTWVLQAYLLAYVHDLAPQAAKDRTLQDTAASVGLKRSAAYDLVRIWRDVVADQPDLVQLPGITKQHFTAVIRTPPTGDDTYATVLQRASDDAWSAQQLARYLKGHQVGQTTHVWYLVATVHQQQPDMPAGTREVQLARGVIAHVTPLGDVYLQITQFV